MRAARAFRCPSSTIRSPPASRSSSRGARGACASSRVATTSSRPRPPTTAAAAVSDLLPQPASLSLPASSRGMARAFSWSVILSLVSGRIALATGLFWGLLVGCGGGRSLPADGGGGQGGNALDQQLIADVDVLFVIKDSREATVVQQNLVANFPAFVAGLRSSDNGLPNLHVGVTTTSMGAGAFTATVPTCQTPDLGNLVHDVRAATDPVCTSARIRAGDHFIVALANESQTNYSGNLSDVFRCIAQVGSSACIFEQPLAAARAALGDPTMGLQAPAGNQGFLRDAALLAVILVDDEDDCSVPPDSMLFDPSQTMLSDPLGPLASFRCTEFGITCDG